MAYRYKFYVSQDGDTKVIRKISISLKEAE